MTLVENGEPESMGDELRDVGSGSNPATPAWLLLSVAAAVGALFAVAVTLVTVAYALP